MKKIIMLSDIHGNISALEQLEPLFVENDYVFFLGDGLSDIRPYAEKFGEKIICVKGNRDSLGINCPDEKIVKVECIKFFLTHGDKYRVEQTLLNVAYEAISKGCNVCCYGHTHNYDISTFDGLTLINGGAFFNPVKDVNSYALIEVNGENFEAKIVELL